MTWEIIGYVLCLLFVVLFVVPLIIVTLVASFYMWRDIFRGEL